MLALLTRLPRLPSLPRLPRAAWIALAALLLLAGAALWHKAQLRSAFAEGARQQANADTNRVATAAARAAAEQRRVIAATGAAQARISKETDDALADRLADLGRRLDDLRLRHAAALDPGRPGEGRATALPETAGLVADSACAAAGWVSFDTAAAAAAAADAGIAKDDAWRDWVAAQAAAWPK